LRLTQVPGIPKSRPGAHCKYGFALALLLGCNSGSAPSAPKSTPVASITVTPAADTLAADDTLRFSAQPKDAAGNPLMNRTVSWTTSDAAIAGVSMTGLVTGTAAGSVTIRATSEGQSGAAALRVTARVALVTITPATTAIVVTSTAIGGIIERFARVFATWEPAHQAATGSTLRPYRTPLGARSGIIPDLS